MIGCKVRDSGIHYMFCDCPFFSVVIPTHERPRLLIRAIESVLKSNRHDVEIIVVNDGSKASYREVAERYGGRVRYVENTVPMGAAFSRNRGVSLSKGRWIAFLDDDDEFACGYIGRIEEAIQSSGDCCAVWTGARVIRKEGGSKEEAERIFPESYAATKHLIKDFLSVGLGFGFAIDRSVFFDVGMFDESFVVGEDTEFFFRLISHGFIPRPVPGIGVVKHEDHGERLSSSYEVYSNNNIYNKIFTKHREKFCQKWEYNYVHLLMWSYRLHREYGNRSFGDDDFETLVELGIPEKHIDECYVTGEDLSIEYME